MDVEDGAGKRVLWVQYRLRYDSDARSCTLLREERPVEGRLPLSMPGDPDPPDQTGIDAGRKRSFEIASGVEDMAVRYVWVPAPSAERFENPGEPPEAAEAIESDDPFENENWGQPQSIVIALSAADPSSEEGLVRFETFITFPNAPTFAGRENAL
jgi:hypothetical protein